MKDFFKTITLFIIPISFILISGLFLPPTPRASKSLLFANKHKDSLLMNCNDPRLIFIGGSNLSFGLNSLTIKDSLCMNPINTAVHANIGVKYMLENTINYVRNNDIIVLAFEYSLFYKPYNSVTDELLRTIIDVSPEKRNLLSFKQKVKMLKYIPKFTITKFKPSEYFGFHESDVYSVNSFNRFGDVDAHWELKNRKYEPIIISGNINLNIFKKIKAFELKAKNKGAQVYITFPSLDEISFKNSKDKILQVEKYFKIFDFKILGNAKRYIMPKEMMFNTHYHLNKKGLDYRTNLFIEDFKHAQKPEIINGK